MPFHILSPFDARSIAPLPEAVAKLSALDEPLPKRLSHLNASSSNSTKPALQPQRRWPALAFSALSLAAHSLSPWQPIGSPAPGTKHTGLYAPTPATARLEEVTLRWLLDLFGLPSECGGAFVTGATMANFSALAAARHAVLQKAGWNVEAEGLCGASAITVVVGAEAHPHFSSPWGFWDWAGIESLPCQSIRRVGCVRTHCRL